MNTKNILNLCLCQGRHEIPDATDGSIFSQEVNPLDVPILNLKLLMLCGINVISMATQK